LRQRKPNRLKPEEAGLILGGIVGAMVGGPGVVAGGMFLGYLLGKQQKKRELF